MSVVRQLISVALLLLAVAAPMPWLAQPAMGSTAQASTLGTVSASPVPDANAGSGTKTDADSASGSKPDAKGVSGSKATNPEMPFEPATAEERQMIVRALIWSSFTFVFLSLALMTIVVYLIRGSFWKEAAQLGPKGWRKYLLQLPLGAPEGSIRALLSLFVVVFGFIVIALQRYLALGGGDAIAGFVGTVITFYFMSRNSEQARNAALLTQDAANKATQDTANVVQKASEAATSALRDNSTRAHDLTNRVLDNSSNATTLAMKTVARAAVLPGAPPDPTDATGDVTDAQSKLSSLRDKLTVIQQVARSVNDLGVGGNVLPKAAVTLSTVDDLLSKVQPLLTGKPDLASVANVLQTVTAELPALQGAGLPGALGEAIEVLGTVALPIISGLPGGPIGIAGGVLIAAIRLAGRQRDLANFKAALLGQPFDPVLLPDGPDLVASKAALLSSPLMQAHFPDASNDTQMRLMALATGKAVDGTRRNAADLAELCGLDITNKSNDVLPERNPEFASADELSHAFDEYLGVLIQQNASSLLPADVTVPAFVPAQPEQTMGLKTLADTASQLALDPKAMAQLERLTYLGEALSKLPMNKEQAVAIVTDALATVADSALVLTTPEATS